MPSLKVITLTRRTIMVKYHQDGIVEDVMKEIEKKEGIPVDQLTLIYPGRGMIRDSLLSDYNVYPGCTIFMIQRLCG